VTGGSEPGTGTGDAGRDTAEPAVTLDCLGKRCPLPIIELARTIREVPVGAVVRVLADDPAAANDVAAFCRMRGHELRESAPPRFDVGRLG